MKPRQTLSTNDFKPAEGLQRLTWPQIEKIDALVSSLCAYAEQVDNHQALVLPFFLEISRNGKPARITGQPLPIQVGQPMLVEALKPDR